MTCTTIHRFINAPAEAVFDTVAHINNFRKAIPDIINVEFVSDVQKGVGAHFKETRNMNGRKGYGGVGGLRIRGESAHSPRV